MGCFCCAFCGNDSNRFIMCYYFQFFRLVLHCTYNAKINRRVVLHHPSVLGGSRHECLVRGVKMFRINGKHRVGAEPFDFKRHYSGVVQQNGVFAGLVMLTTTVKQQGVLVRIRRIPEGAVGAVGGGQIEHIRVGVDKQSGNILLTFQPRVLEVIDDFLFGVHLTGPAQVKVEIAQITHLVDIEMLANVGLNAVETFYSFVLVDRGGVQVDIDDGHEANVNNGGDAMGRVGRLDVMGRKGFKLGQNDGPIIWFHAAIVCALGQHGFPGLFDRRHVISLVDCRLVEEVMQQGY